jgi:pimeloyl-ACP methyl ester carboxylesterase
MAGRTVVVIPGFMSSALQFEKSFFGNRLVWFSQAQLALDGPDPLQLDDQGEGPGPLADGALETAGIAAGSRIGAVIDRLTALGDSPQLFTYDWRKSIVRNADVLADVLKRTIGNKPFYVVAHSMGGLLARLAYPAYVAAFPRANWRRTIYLGTPHGGSYAATSALAVNIGTGNWAYTLATKVGSLLRGGALKLVFQPSMHDRLATVLASWPGLLELMPTPLAPFNQLDPLLPPVYTVAKWNGANQYVTQGKLDAAAATQLALSNQAASTQPPGVDVISDDFDTPDQLQDNGPLTDPATYKVEPFGDVQVAKDRGSLPGNQVLTVTGKHQDLPAQADFLAALDSLLDNGLPVNETIEPSPVPFKGQTFVVPQAESTVQLVTIAFPSVNTKFDP